MRLLGLVVVSTLLSAIPCHSSITGTEASPAAELPDSPGTVLVRLQSATALARVNADAWENDAPHAERAVLNSTNERPRFHWTPALLEMGEMLAIQHTGNLAMDAWMREKFLHGKFVKEWFKAVSDDWRWTVWNDNDPFLDDYIAHPLQGSVYALIYIQNDDRGRYLKLENSRAYWKSRLRAFAWSVFWSAQWKVGPFSEASIGNLGNLPYYSDSSKGMSNGTGVIDFVMTPVGGMVFLVGEEALDKYVIRFVRGHSRNKAWWLALSILTPTHSAANILRMKAPWHRDLPPTRRMAVAYNDRTQ